MMASELPPFSALAVAPACHCGRAAARHLPEPLGALETKLAGIHAPVARVAMVPLAMPWNHWSLQLEIGATSFSVISCCQTLTNSVLPGSVKLIVTSVPLTVYGLPPACQIMLVVKPASPV